MTDPRVIMDRMELLGEATVREQVASGQMTAEQKRDAQIWLGMKAMERKALDEAMLSAAQDQARHTRGTKLIAFAALVLSVIATAVAVAAFVYG